MSDHKNMKMPEIWQVEPNRMFVAALAKLQEECAELTGISARCQAQGVNGKNPDTGEPNLEALADECADAMALIRVVRELILFGKKDSTELLLNDRIEERIIVKYQHKMTWLQELDPDASSRRA